MSTPDTMASVLVTGGTGFVGSRLIRALLARGGMVHALVRPQSQVAQLPAPSARFVIHRAETHAGAYAELMRATGTTVVFHLASLCLTAHKPEDVPRLIDSNIAFGTALLEAASVAGVTRFVNTGTNWEHFGNAEYRPVNLYAATKQAFEAIIAYYADARKMKVVTLKLFDTYGPGDPRGKLISLLHDATVTGKTLQLSPGDQLLDLVYIDDVCSAFMRAAERTAEIAAGTHERFAVSGGRRISVRDLVGLMHSTLRLNVPVVFGGRAYRDREVMIPWTGTVLPGWSPKTTLVEGLVKTFGGEG